MTAHQERRILKAAIEYARADEVVAATRNQWQGRENGRNVPTVERAAALKARAAAKKRLISAVGRNRPQVELPLADAFPTERPRMADVEFDVKAKPGVRFKVEP